MNNKFSENIKKIRKDNHLSQEDLAEALGVSRQAISKWESSAAYPEMDKIIQICDKFGVNIDDLLHKDIKELKGEEETKNKVNKYIDDFFEFITDTVRLFENMSFKSQVKCLFEQCIIIFILFLIFAAIYCTGEGIMYNIFYNVSNSKIFNIIGAILNSIYLLFSIVSSLVIMVHIFNIRYLDYFKSIKNSSNVKEKVQVDNEQEKNTEKEPLSTDENNKILFKKNKDKIIIRDPDHSEYRFLNGIVKLMIFGIKFCAFWIELGLCISLLFIVALAVASFLIWKTGIIFIAILIGLIASGIINVIFILIIFNFMFNRKSNKKLMIWTFIISIISLGACCGLLAVGSINFDIETYQESPAVVKSIEVAMEENLFVDNYMDRNKVEYVEEARDNVKVEYETYDEYELDYYISGYGNLHVWPESINPFKMIRRVIDDINDKKIISYRSSPENAKIRIYASKENILKLQANRKLYYDKEQEKQNLIDEYEERYEEYEQTIRDYEEKVTDLEGKLNDYETQLELYRDIEE